LGLTIFTLTFVFILIYLSPKNGTVYAGENIWTWAGVNGYVYQIVTDPVNPNAVYARIDTNRIMKSTDGGNTWSNIAAPDWSNIRSIAMAYSAPNVLYVRTISGTHRTTDSGSTWQQVYPYAYAVAVSPVDWKEAYLVATSADTLPQQKVYKTLDGGETWREIGILPNNPPVDALFIAPSAPNILMTLPMSSQTGIYKSIDGGKNWSLVNNDLNPDWGTLVFDPKNSNTIYVGIGGGSPGGWKSIDGGNTWQPLANGLQQNCRGFVIDPDNTQVIHAANMNAGVMESLDGGMSWAPINTGIQGLSVRSIAIASRKPLVIYAGLEGGGIWKMTRTTIQDFGITINEGALFTNQTAVTLTLTAPPGTTQMIVSNDGGFGGATWEPFANSKSWTITAYGSYVIPRTVYVKFMTNGQISGQYQDDIILDLTPPTGTVEITSTNGSVILPFSLQLITGLGLTDTLTHTVYLPIVTRNLRPGFTQIGLILSATDDLSGVGEMLIGNDADFIDAQWEAYIERKNWWIPNSSTTMYVKFRDRAGNESDTYTAAVTP